MNTFKVTFVFEDSSTLSNLVVAPTEELGVNTLVNRLKIKKTPKFTIVESPNIFYSEDDYDLVKDFKEYVIGDTPTYTFKNKLSEVITVGNVSVTLGDLADYTSLLEGY